ncbi:C4-dicarboxylate ABC transporter substrate-binding protein [Rhodosalinus halophilus]|uniref:C4-dicarboxylate ABC transporter substrate-binding protein n=1 Tax=Rhodosalinus halophilus TaxID=2259333 RepID=A0A365U9Z1_9RHOB|nr:TRAP transporter substrate-binding protein DctP [Rhodosalinus halophilus]RBI85825.1 C4-dicarboxylate ABC transporter substrate-binding protein [Rhodosalinus halophilus]
MAHQSFRIAAAAAALALAPAVAAAQEQTLRAITAFPSGLAFSQSFLGFVEMVNERGEGVVQIDYAGGPETVPQNQQIDAVRRGIVDMQYGPASFYLGRMPEADAWVGSTVTAMEARENGGFEVMQQAFSDKLGVELLAHIDSGVQFHIYTLEEPPRDAEGNLDLDGLQIRSQPIYRSFFEELGATPISVNVPDVYTGLERNTFDGAGWPIVGIKDLNWDRFLRYRVDPGFFQTDLAVVVSPDSWEQLSEEARTLLTEVAAEYEKISHDNFQQIVAETDATVREEGMTVIELEGAARERFLDLAYDSAWSRMREAGTEHYDALRDAYYDR